MEQFRDQRTLNEAISNIDKIINVINKAIKDEKEAQEMYTGLTRNATTLGRFEPVFTRINSQISSITRDENRHERELKEMLNQITDTKKRMSLEIKRRVDLNLNESRSRYGR